MSLFQFEDYKGYVLDKLAQMPKKGRGQFRKLAAHLNVNPVIISQVFKGPRDLSLEQAYDCCDFFGFGKLEKTYFLILVQRDRAGTERLKKLLSEQLQEIKERSEDLKSRIKAETELTEQDKAQFYSNWYYSGIRLITDIEGFDQAEKVAQYLNLPLTKVREVLEFLITHGLVSESQGQLKVGLKSTHISKDSPLVTNHHRNWRVQAIKKMDNQSDGELFFTAPMVLSLQAYEKMREDIVELISKISKDISESNSEQLVCLNIDLMKI